MIVTTFQRNNNGLIIIAILFNKFIELELAFDTGATNTTIDSNSLAMFGFDLSDSIETVMVETANGLLVTDIFEMENVSALGLNKENFQVQVYDFLQSGIASDYAGILGLDFLEGLHFCIDTLTNELTIHQ